MKKLFDQVSESCSRIVTESYSTSFTLATKMLDSSIRQDIYNIYGFVRFADEIVDSFHNYDKKELLDLFEKDLTSVQIKDFSKFNWVYIATPPNTHLYYVKKLAPMKLNILCEKPIVSKLSDLNKIISTCQKIEKFKKES